MPKRDRVKPDSASKMLHYAAKHGDNDTLKKLLAQGVHPDSPDKQNRTALMVSKKLAFEIVDLLLEAGADPNASDLNGDTPLHYNVREKDYLKYRRLIDNGADLLALNSEGVSPFEILLGSMDYLNIVKITRGAKEFTRQRILEVIKDPKHINELGIFGLWETQEERAYGDLLHSAIQNSDVDTVKNLLLKKPFVETLNKAGYSPLHAAIVYCTPLASYEIVKALLNVGASRDRRGTAKISPLEAALICVEPDIVHLIDPDYTIPDTVKKRITHITIVDNKEFQVMLYPNDPGVHLSILQHYPRAEEAAGKWSAKDALELNRDLIKKVNVQWLIPLLEEYATGSLVDIEELKQEYQKHFKGELKIHFKSIK